MEVFTAALCSLCPSKISSIFWEICAADNLGHATMSLIKMCFYIETCGRVFLITMKMLDVFYKLEVEGNEE